MKRILYLIPLIFIFISATEAQVGINTENPRNNAVLDMRLPLDENNNSIPRGVYLPALTTAERDAIHIPLDKNSINGLFIFNLDTGCLEFYSVKYDGWKSLCPDKFGDLEYILNSAKIMGDYVKNTPLIPTVSDLGNYMNIELNVITPGQYTMIATSRHFDYAGSEGVDNGYYFSTSGIASATGHTIINLPGGGTPRLETSDTDDYPIDSIYLYINDEFKIALTNRVQNNIVESDYTIGTPRFIGEAKVGQTLTTSNYVEVPILSVGSDNTPWSMTTTNPVNGLKFSGSGIIGTQTTSVRLYAESNYNRPTTSGSFTYTVTTDAKTPQQKTFTISFIMKKIRIYGIGTSDFNLSHNNIRQSMANNLTSNSAAFPIEGYEIQSKLAYKANINEAMNNADIIFFGYDTYSKNIDYNTMDNFLDNGGTVVFCVDNFSEKLGDFLEYFFGTSTTMSSAEGATAHATFISTGLTSGTNSYDIINGPFGNLSGQSLYANLTGNWQMLNLSGNQYEILANRNGNPRAIVHKTRNIIVISDGGVFGWFNFTPSRNIMNDKFFYNIIAWGAQRLSQK